MSWRMTYFVFFILSLQTGSSLASTTCVEIFKKPEVKYTQRKHVQQLIQQGKVDEVLAFFEMYPEEINYQFPETKFTYLMWALNTSNKSTVDWLLVLPNLNLDARDFLGRTYLLHAIQNEDVLTALQILQKPLSRKSFKDDDGNTARDYVRIYIEGTGAAQLEKALREYNLYLP